MLSSCFCLEYSKYLCVIVWDYVELLQPTLGARSDALGRLSRQHQASDTPSTALLFLSKTAPTASLVNGIWIKNNKAFPCYSQINLS